jgi:REP element-mobilizing transposase RayT
MIESAPEAVRTAPEMTRPAPETVQRVIEALEAIPEEGQLALLSTLTTSEIDLGEGKGRDDDEEGEEGELPEISLSALLAAMPPPDPAERKLEPGIEWITGDEEDGTAGDFLFPWEKEAQEKVVEKETAIPSQQTYESAGAEVSQQLSIETAEVETSTQLAAELVTLVVPAQPATDPETMMAVANDPGEQTAAVAAKAPFSLASLPEPPPSEGATEKIIRPAAKAPAADATRPMNLQSTASTQRVASPFAGVPLPQAASPEPWNQVDEQDPPSGDFASLTYTCVMLPRLTDVKLSGRLVNKLAERLQQICLAYGWRLVNQVIRPDTFQWTVQVSAIVSPGSVARVVRQQTSQFLFDQFEQFNSLIPSGDFWAPGYLIISGPQPPDTRLIGEYIKQTRRRQGIRL